MTKKTHFIEIFFRCVLQRVALEMNSLSSDCQLKSYQRVEKHWLLCTEYERTNEAKKVYMMNVLRRIVVIIALLTHRL